MLQCVEVAYSADFAATSLVVVVADQNVVTDYPATFLYKPCVHAPKSSKIAYSEHVIVDYFPLPPRPMARAGVGSRNPTAFALPDQRLESEEYPCPGLACMGRGGKGKSAEAVRHIVVGKHGKLVPSKGGGGGRSVGEGAWSLAPLPARRTCVEGTLCCFSK